MTRDAKAGVLVIALFPVATVVRGWVLSILWAWFFVPLGLIAIGVAHAIGISMMVGMLTYQHDLRNESDSDGVNLTAKMIGVGILLPLFILLFGWVVKGFM